MMKPEEEINNKLDILISQALEQEPEIHIPPEFSDKIIHRIEKQQVSREIWLDYGMKAITVAASLFVFIALLILAGRHEVSPWLDLIANNWQLLASLVLVVLFTSVFDQVVLRYMMKAKS
jgi:hypothetical protein